MEPMRNIAFLCPKHRRHPDPKYMESTPAWFIDKFCKLSFPCPDGRNENMWVKTIGFAESGDQELRGVLNNDPIFADIKCGDMVEFCRSEIIEVIDVDA